MAKLLRLALRHRLRPAAHIEVRRLLGRLDLDVAQLRLVIVVLVHGDDARLRVHGVHVRDRHLALDPAIAVAARAVQLAKVLHVEAVDRHRAVAVVLDHLVVRETSTASDHLRHAGRRATLDAQRVLAHVVPPDVLDRASAILTVNALSLVLADDDVLEDGAGLNEEHRGR
ncbi:hypothetical protein PybrP1_010001 [[Pythium] brassicae (nom. inval.)]|nr:hypothetical protein PybrP1_010001 [[Pythium] brassicae (nom. inval.)]